MILDELKKNNEFPTLFIGSGMSKRYLEDYPDWINLLKYFWEQTDSKSFFGEFNKLNDLTRKENKEFTEAEIIQLSLIRMGSIIEEKYNDLFNSEKIRIPNFTVEDAFNKKVSPFKQAIATKFKEYNIKSDMLKEYVEFKNMLVKSQIILTTNYDTFIEDSYDSVSKYKIKCYVGQRGFFENTSGLSELYKIHGSIDYPWDIVITEEDYESFKNNSILISAKITSMMMNSPIIFIGYSLSDPNIRRIIKNITTALSAEELSLFEKRIVVIQWKEGIEELVEERLIEKDLGCRINVINTDNYMKVFSIIGSINQGLMPSEVQKYMSIIKKLVIDKGKKGTLNTVLISPEGIEKLGEDAFKNVVVAIGGPEYIFQIPDIFTYCIDYISDKDEINNEIRLRFIALQNPRSRVPLCKFLNAKIIDSSNLMAKEKTKLREMIASKTDFEKAYSSINGAYFGTKVVDVNTIINSKEKKRKIYNTLGHYIKKLNLEELKEYLLKELNLLKYDKAPNISSELRRLILLYDILRNKKK